MPAKSKGVFKNAFFVLLLFLCLLAAFWAGLQRTGQGSAREQLQAVETAVRRAAVTCYALEGIYPAELAYLKEHYGLTIDESRYAVHYYAFSSNLFPEIDVLELS